MYCVPIYVSTDKLYESVILIRKLKKLVLLWINVDLMYETTDKWSFIKLETIEDYIATHLLN